MIILYILTLVFFMFLFFFFVQLYLIYPIESFLLPSSFIDQASFLYLPHSIRIIAYFIFGKIIIIPIFLSQCFTFIIINGGDIYDSLFLSTISSLSIIFGFELFKYFKKNNLYQINKFIDWKQILLIGFFASLSNSFFSSVYFFYNRGIDFNFNLMIRYVMGDCFGLFFGMLFFIFLIKFFGSYLNNVISKIR